MRNASPDQALRETLERFETCLETPVVPGDMPQWCAAAHAACTAVRGPLQTSIHRHAEQYREILHEDPGLASHVEAMQEEDRSIGERLNHVESLLQKLCAVAEAVEPDEAKLNVSVEKATAAGLELIISVRKQETAITTWLLEALERDPGVVD